MLTTYRLVQLNSICPVCYIVCTSHWHNVKLRQRFCFKWDSCFAWILTTTFSVGTNLWIIFCPYRNIFTCKCLHTLMHAWTYKYVLMHRWTWVRLQVWGFFVNFIGFLNVLFCLCLWICCCSFFLFFFL